MQVEHIMFYVNFALSFDLYRYLYANTSKTVEGD